MKKDVEHAKLQSAHDAPTAVAKAIAQNDPTMQRKRGRMMLPAPQVPPWRICSSCVCSLRDAQRHEPTTLPSMRIERASFCACAHCCGPDISQ